MQEGAAALARLFYVFSLYLSLSDKEYILYKTKNITDLAWRQLRAVSIGQ